MNRINYLKEEIPAKEKELQELRSKLDQEKRARTEEEKQSSIALTSEISDMRSELNELLDEEKRKSSIVDTQKVTIEDISKRSESPKVTNDNKKTEEYRNAKTFSLIQANMVGNAYEREEAQRSLAEGGHYDDILKGDKLEQRSFSTLLDPKGGVFLPQSISSQIMDIMQTYGVIPANATNFGDISQGSLKIPQILGRPAFSAVSQGGTITGSGFNLGGIELKALKWGAIIDWTNEVDESVGARLMPIIMDKLAEGYAYVQDNTFFNGDGTSTYNGIKGLEGLAGSANYVRVATATGNATFAALTADNFLAPQENVAPGARSGGIYVMHPNMIFTLRKLKDGQGKYIYGDPNELQPAGSLWGHRIVTSEAFPIADGSGKTACAFFNPSYVAYATGRTLTADRLKEGIITNEDSTSVNLATTDAQALRVTGLFDLILSTVTRSTNSVAQGAFSILRTA